MRAAGGGGAGGQRSFGTHVGGCGGGGGERRIGNFLAAALGSTETITVGAGGPGGLQTTTATANSGTDGGDSSFGAHLIARGGAGAIRGTTSTNGVPGNAVSNPGGTGGTGGTGTAGKKGRGRHGRREPRRGWRRSYRTACQRIPRRQRTGR
jgi:hypothetical protein